MYIIVYQFFFLLNAEIRTNKKRLSKSKMSAPNQLTPI